MVTFKRLQITNERRAKRWHKSGLDDWSALEWAGAMCGEAGEAANASKKLKRLEGKLRSINRGKRNIKTIERARDIIAEECADTIIYAVLLMSVVRRDAGSIIRRVFNKKSIEYGFKERL